jgi:signal transduction histidine kinase
MATMTEFALVPFRKRFGCCPGAGQNDGVAAPCSLARFRSTGPRALYRLAFGLYVAAFLVWLGLGLLPFLASAIGPVQDALVALSDGSGSLADGAGRVLAAGPTLPHGARVVLQYLFSILNLALGLLLALRGPRDLVPRLLAFAFIGTAATFNRPSHVVFRLLPGAPLIGQAHLAFHIASGVAYLWAVVLFPDGKLPARSLAVGWRPVRLITVLTVLLVWACYSTVSLDHTPLLVVLFGVLVPAAGIAAQSWRLHAGQLSPTARQQSRLLRVALGPALLTGILWLVGTALARSGDGGTATVTGPVGDVFPAVFAVVPIILFVAILRYRLWDLDLVLSRTLLMAMLAGFVAAVYAAVLATTSLLLRDREAWSVVAAMTAVGLAVEPVRRRSARLANRLVFGQRMTPREAMRVLADRLEHQGSGDELCELTDVVAAGTRCSAASVWLVVDDGLLLAAASPPMAAESVRRLQVAEATLSACAAALPEARCVPVTHEGRLLAVLALGIPAGIRLPLEEERLVHDLAGQAGMLVANARLTQDLSRQVELVTTRAEELRRSREQVVAAQDAERQRLERDIHDGAQQELVALLVGIRTLQRAASSADQARPAGLARVRASLADARRTLRELCEGGAPPVLRDNGLAAALRTAVAAAGRAGLDVAVDCDVPDRLPAEIEAAVYFCCLEALQNAAKHARARQATVQVSLDRDHVVLLVGDDGVGFEPSSVDSGGGLSHFADRVTVLGGTAEVESAQGEGTRIRCRIPLVAQPPVLGVGP